MDQNEFENSDEDQIMQEDDSDYSLVRHRSRQGEQSNPENETITRSARHIRA